MTDDGRSWRGEFRDGLRWLRDAANMVAVPKAVAKERYAICLACEHFNSVTKQCRVCDCFMPLKTRMNIAPCPEGKWSLVDM